MLLCNCQIRTVGAIKQSVEVLSLFFGRCLFYTKPYRVASGQENIESSGLTLLVQIIEKNLFFAMGTMKTHKGTKAGPILYCTPL